MLENGLEALVISDPKCDKASAAMDVKVGHLSDPEDLQGLAHFCEHLMFMGTDKVKTLSLCVSYRCETDESEESSTRKRTITLNS
jgi:predicted Zn-dependent peptidase